MFKNRLYELRTKNKFTQEELGKRVGVGKTTISNYEKGERNPDNDTLIKLAEVLNTSSDFLLGLKSPHDTNYSHPFTTANYITYPVIGEIAAGYNTPPLEDWEGEKIDIPLSYLNGRDASQFFVLEVKGNSMYPHYQEGDKVLILSQKILDYSGQVAAVIYDSEFATLKKIEYPPNREWVKLVPTNPIYEEQKIEKEDLERFTIMGVPKMLIRHINKE